MLSTLSQRRAFTPLALIVLGLAPLCAAWFAQYVLNYPPCPLCMAQRYPYGAVVMLGVVSLFMPLRHHSILWWLATLGFAITAAIALYHVGIELGIFTEEGGCTSKPIGADISLEALRQQLMNAPLVACNVVALRFLGLSMAAWNALLAIILCAASFYCARHLRRTAP